MSYQYAFCPTCGTKRVALDYRCTVCDGFMRRVPFALHTSAAPRTRWWSGHLTKGPNHCRRSSGAPLPEPIKTLRVSQRVMVPCRL